MTWEFDHECRFKTTKKMLNLLLVPEQEQEKKSAKEFLKDLKCSIGR